MAKSKPTAPAAPQAPRRASLALVKNDPWLAPFEPVLQQRLARLRARLAEIEQYHGSLANYATAHQQLGLNHDASRGGYVYREWAPGATALYLVGDFNGWDRQANPLQKLEYGVWEVFLPDAEYQNRLTHGSRYKVHVVTAAGGKDRLPATLRRAVQDEQTKDYSAQVWRPETEFTWTDQKFKTATAAPEPLIYEAHVGMATEEGRVGTYREFADNILPRIEADGYNTIQLMAVQEHPYYGSFGYHVANLFAASSRFGTPEDLKFLINEAHRRGIAVLLDIVHSHAVKNEAEGLADFDGSGNLYFHKGERGNHPGWDSKLFDYGRPEVQQFLLSNVRFWLEEYHFDGFRFDGVTSMLYHHHGEGVAFMGYDNYFGPAADEDAILYLQLATTLAHEFKKGSILIAEDMSGLPGLCRPIKEGGVGFDFRLAMGIPDYWIKLLKHTPDENWPLGDLWHTLTNRRAGEKTIAYAESHDQALVGDKTLSHWLIDAGIYTHMQAADPDPGAARGVALHKLIRLLTLAAGGEGYLTFIGNEFGHPEWVDFPREGNGWSYHFARRQWSLGDNPDLKYHQLGEFDKAMVHMARERHLLAAGPAHLLKHDEENKVLVFERAGLVFVVNFHVENSLVDYRFWVTKEGKYHVILSSDNSRFGGFDRPDESYVYETFEHQLSLYVPSRVALVLEAVESSQQ
ncbi:alpha amylase C-terminal domain-containing protein [Hymenobacter sp. BT770]|uniref:alpha amylase C-terminal domain-containing protein n=1 Tax=Hymenobacter sp. BT770 TaxID=2886942 RepID=UPI001D127F43|nr:alpha amylase C-terminal domain-containing protein [Hymenobacter sp. BT770]MCC3155572.1 alpha amylase C-terminal domain-containing protein [Hymenobacter sp. BT770]MDO3414832.1 alpha amylase C-terminal domain-containing protein [Hymenobacter sp. BT770]